MAPSHCWLHPGVAVRESKIEGRGLFATVRLVEGTSVSRVGGRIVPSTALASLLAARDHDPSQPYVDTIMIDDDAHLILPPGNLNHYGNHSCDPNLWWADGFTLDARCDIEPGTELTNDYGTSPGIRRTACRVRAARQCVVRP